MSGIKERCIKGNVQSSIRRKKDEMNIGEKSNHGLSL